MGPNKFFNAAGKVKARLKTSQVNLESSIYIPDLLPLRQLPKHPKLAHVLQLFRGESAENIYYEISDFIKAETGAEEMFILRMYGEDFEVLFKSTLQKFTFASKKMSGMPEVIVKKMPVLLERGLTMSWKVIFKEQPNVLIIIPITVPVNKTTFVMGAALLAYYGDVPIIMEEENTWNILLDYLELTIPLVINVKKYEEAQNKCQRLVTCLESLSKAERDIHDITKCVRTLATEMGDFLSATYVQVLIMQQEIVEDKKLHKFCTIGNGQIEHKHCLNPNLHLSEDIQISPDTCVGYVAINAKILRANNISDLASYGIKANTIHSVGGCVVSNILCIPISEHSGEAPLILEISEKPGGFSIQDEEQAQLFAKRAASILSSSILLDYKKKAIRRHGIRNEVLANIGAVSHFRVKQLLDLEFQYSSSFRKKLHDFRFSMRIFPDHQSPGVMLFIFMDLGFVQRWKMRKSTLIRFILSMQQGYRDIPYHNWKHACCVTHFAYLLLKKLDLIKQGYLTDLEALTLIISCLAHDIDHRGRNNHFNLCTKSELYHLYKQEDSIMERHHIAVALSVLNSEDCNIVQNMTDEEYREFIELIQWNILATDLAKYMQNRSEYFYTLQNFDSSQKMHRKHLAAIIMTSSDLCDNIKTWDANLPCVKSIFHEFFAQGDDEIALGLKPMPMMDRRVAYVPKIEIYFINNVVRPAYQALADLLPPTRVCLTTLDYFVDLWLVSTAVFDENSDLEDPLLIIDLPDMKEEHLRKRKAPLLQSLLAEHGVAGMSIAQIGSHADSNHSFTSIKGSSPRMPEQEVQKRSSIRLSDPARGGKEQISCGDFLKNWLCCYACRNRGLVAARAIRKLRLDDKYLDQRVVQYERRRSVDSADGIPEHTISQSQHMY